MNRGLAHAAWIAFAAIMYLVLTEALGSWIRLPGLGDIGFTLVFVVFSLLHCAACAGWRRTGLFFTLAAAISYLLEEIGVRTGWIYGAYHYGPMLGPKLGHVPVLIPLAWFMMIYPSWIVARALTRRVDTGRFAGLAAQAAIAAMVMTGWDVVMDPGMAASGNWVWEHGGAYFGVPMHNYFGWLLTTFLVYLGAGLLWRSEGAADPGAARVARRVPPGFAALPIVLYTFYGISYVAPRKIPSLQVVALFAMVLPGLLALIEVWMPKKPEKFDQPGSVIV